MGEVFFAWAYGVARTRKPVVVKVLRSEMLSEPGAPEMFVEEGRLSLHLSHMNILQVFDFGKADDRYFMAMEFVDGMHLGELRKKAGGRLNHDLAAFICMEVCLALDYAHRLKDESGRPLQIVHRDVTPSNVLISREGEVKLADFGIARAVGRSQHTQAGQIRGKVRYMSPEAARGEPLDHRSDLFSLGAVLFELLTGRRAFDAKGGREAILKQIVSGRAPAPSTAGDIHPALDAVVLKAMSPRREDRYTDAFAMHRGIEEACRDAGLRPSRGAFLEFLRALESAAATAEANSWSDPVDPAPAFPPVLMATPSAGRASNARSEGTVGVAPPPISRSGVMPARESALQAPTVAPSASGSRAASKPSSSAGAVPPEIEGPQSTILPTGVQSPVLFTLVMGERENTPDLQDLPVFDVTREGMSVNLDFLPKVAPVPEEPEPPSRQRSDRIAPVIAADLPSGEKTIPPLRPMPPITVSVEPSHPSADARPSERITDRRSEGEDERVTVDPDSGPRMERITGSSAETEVRSSPVPLGYREPAPPPDDVAERRPDEDRWSVRRQEVPFTSPLLSPPPSSRPSRPARVRVGPGVYVGGLVVIFVFAILLVKVTKRGENTAPTPAAHATRRTPEPTATLEAPTQITVVTAPVATPLSVVPTARPRATDTPAPVETRVAAVSTARPRPTATPRTVATATPRTVATAATAMEPGVLVLNTQPWTEFTIAGRALHTPVNGEKIPPGHYTVTLHSKYNPKLDRTIEIDVRSGATTRILLDLTHP